MNLVEYLLTHTSEEGSELIKACSKALRFGLPHFWDKEQKTNVEAIREELIDVMAMARILARNDVIEYITEDEVTEAMQAKKQKLLGMFQLAQRLGRIDPDARLQA